MIIKEDGVIREVNGITPERLMEINGSRDACTHCYFPLFSFAMIKNIEEEIVTEYWHCVQCETFYQSVEVSILPKEFKEIPYREVKDMFEYYQRHCKIRRVSEKEFDAASMMWLYCNPTKKHSRQWCLKITKDYERKYNLRRSFFKFQKTKVDKPLRVYYKK